MNWINVHTSTLRAPEYIGSEPIARATWLNVLAYCCEQENNGRIEGGAHWKDRQWQQTCGVTLAEIHAAAPLLVIKGDNLIVWHYPSEKQAVVAAKRKHGQSGGEASGKARGKHQPKQTGSENEAYGSASDEAETKHMVERNGMEGEGKEKGRARDSLVPSLFDFCEFYHEQIPDLGAPCEIGDWLMEQHGYLATNVWPERPPKNWKAMLGKLVSDYRGRHAELSARSNGNAPKGKFNSDL